LKYGDMEYNYFEYLNNSCVQINFHDYSKSIWILNELELDLRKHTTDYYNTSKKYNPCYRNVNIISISWQTHK